MKNLLLAILVLRPRPLRPWRFYYRNNIVEYSKDGIAETRLPTGTYSFLATIPLDDGNNLTTMAAKHAKDWPTYKIVEEEVLEITSRMKLLEAAKASLFVTSAVPASDETNKEVQANEESAAKEQAALDAIVKLGGYHTITPQEQERLRSFRGLNPQIYIDSSWKGGIEGLKHLQAIRRTIILSFHGAPIDDATVDMLIDLDLATVRRFEFYGTIQVSSEAIDRLKKHFPNSQVDVRSGARLGIQGTFGTAKVVNIVSGSAADKAGLQINDLIKQFNGEAIQDFSDLTKRIAKQKPGDTVTLTVERNRKTIQVEVTFDIWGSGKIKLRRPSAQAPQQDDEKKPKPDDGAVHWPEIIQGFVHNGNSGPVADAKVHLSLEKIHYFKMGRWDEKIAEVEGTIDESGLIEFDVSTFPKIKHRPFSLMITGSAPGHANTRTWAWHSQPKADIENWLPEIKLLPSRSITGRCLDPQGEPIGGAIIKVLADHGERWLWSTQQSAADGKFTIEGPINKHVQYWICSDRAAPKWGSVEPSQTELGDIQLNNGTALEGTVLDRAGKPIKDVVVVLESAFTGKYSNHVFSVEFATKTDEQGNYRLPPVFGPYRVFLTQATQTDNQLEGTYVVSKKEPPPIVPHFIQLDGKQSTQQHDIKAGPTLKLSGTAKWEDGRAASGLQVRVSYGLRGVDFGTGIWIAETYTDAEGRYQLEVANPISDILVHSFGLRDEEGVWHRAYHVGTEKSDEQYKNPISFENELSEDRGGLDWVLRPDED